MPTAGAAGAGGTRPRAARSGAGLALHPVKLTAAGPARRPSFPATGAAGHGQPPNRLAGWDRPRDPAGVTVEAAEAAVVQELFASYIEDHASLFSLAKHLQA